jgi:hypothetical protein
LGSTRKWHVTVSLSVCVIHVSFSCVILQGQLKLARASDSCLSQKGPAAGFEDAAAHGAIIASSTADAAAHGANMAVDGSSATFWVTCGFAGVAAPGTGGSVAYCFQASALDPAGPVSVIVDLGGRKSLDSVEILWEFAAKSFTVSVSTDGTEWSEVQATDSNILSSSRIALGSTPAAKVKVVMHEAGCARASLCLFASGPCEPHAGR